MRLCPASHVPLLCLAQELLAVGNHADAVQCLDSARELCDSDPLVLNECGAAAFQQKQFADARRFLEHAESLLTAQMHANVIELVNNNLAHVLRCLQFVSFFHHFFAYRFMCVCVTVIVSSSDYEGALKHFSKCLTLAGGRRRRASVLCSMGYVHHITENYAAALTEYTQSLAAEPENALATELLNQCLADAYAAGAI